MTVEIERECARAECTERFTAARADRKYCSPACKSKANRSLDPETVRGRALVKAIDRFDEVADITGWAAIEMYLETVRARKGRS